MRYDCHTVAHRNARDELSDFLRAGGHTTAVLVQSDTFATSLQCLLGALEHIPGSRGVARLPCWTDVGELAALDQAGVRGVRVDVAHRESTWQWYEDLCVIEEILPMHWHIELSCQADVAARASSVLARSPRTFALCLATSPNEPSDDELARLSWWLDMGNVYLKIVEPAGASTAARWLRRASVDTPDRILLGSGWPHARPGRSCPQGFDRVGAASDANAACLYQFNPHRPSGQSASDHGKTPAPVRNG